MKKAKIMLLSLVLFTLLGAILAFKAKTSTTGWCYTTRTLGVQATTSFCPLILENKRILQGTPTVYATNLKANGQATTIEDDCNAELNCLKVKLGGD